MNTKRYIYDALYGKIYLDPVVWEVFSSPELQRLREVRLCNINSLCLTGGANINRFEHAIGTVYLAQQCLEDWPLVTEHERKIFLLAALFHDAANAAFGHSLEYILSSDGYNPEKGFKSAITGSEKDEENFRYKNAAYENFFFGVKRGLSDKITDAEFDEISAIIRGEGKFGKLINGTIDLDNIDNVYRLAYHIGLIGKTDTPLKLAKSMWTERNKLIIKDGSNALIEEWYKVRKNLYLLLLENPEEFSAKCMLSEVVELERRYEDTYESSYKWTNTDYEVLEMLKKLPNKELEFIETEEELKEFNDELSLKKYIKEKYKKYELIDAHKWCAYKDSKKIYYTLHEGRVNKKVCVTKIFTPARTIEKLVLGRLWPCIAIFSTKQTDYYKQLLDFDNKTLIELKINRQPLLHKYNYKVSIHPILDINKTERKISLLTESGKTINVGNSTHQLLIGVFINNDRYHITDFPIKANLLKAINKEIKDFFIDEIQDENLGELELYSEVNKIVEI